MAIRGTQITLSATLDQEWISVYLKAVEPCPTTGEYIGRFIRQDPQ